MDVQMNGSLHHFSHQPHEQWTTYSGDYAEPNSESSIHESCLIIILLVNSSVTTMTVAAHNTTTATGGAAERGKDDFCS